MSTVVVGQHAAFRKAVQEASRVSTHQTPVLVVGEPGTGKELLARIIHRRSSRRDLPFLAVHCSTLSKASQEERAPELMRKGGSHGNTTLSDILQTTEGGTLYLKDLELLKSDVQEAMVAYFTGHNSGLQSAHATRVTVPRLLAATTMPPGVLEEHQVFHAAFHQLFARSTITIPPLRERGHDVVLLARHFARVYGRKLGLSRCDLSGIALSRLRQYDWPGNVQELEETIVRAYTMSCSDALGSAPPIVADDRQDVIRAPIEDANRSGLSFRQAKAQAIEQFERDYLSSLMYDHRGNVSGAARSAKTERRTFQRLLQKYGLGRADFLKSA